MHHAGQPHVLDIGPAPGHLGWNINALKRLAHHLERRGILQLRIRLRLHMQHVGHDQFAVSKPASVRRDHGPVFGPEIVGRQIPTSCGFRDQQLAHLRGSVLDRGAAVLHRMTAGSITLIGGELRVGGDDLQRRKGNVEFFSRDLLERGLEPLAELNLASEYRDRAIGIDPDPGIEIWRRREASRGFRRRRRSRSGLILCEGTAQRETNDQRASARKNAAAIEDDRGVHRALP